MDDAPGVQPQGAAAKSEAPLRSRPVTDVIFSFPRRHETALCRPGTRLARRSGPMAALPAGGERNFATQGYREEDSARAGRKFEIRFG